jgi:Fibronectin type III domain
MRLATIVLLLATICTASMISESQSTIYWSKDHIYAGADGKEIAVMMPPSSDTTAPTTPSSLAYSSVTATSVYLSWTGSTDSGGSGLAGYKVYRQTGSGASPPVGTVGTSTTCMGGGPMCFTDQPLQPSTSYTYTVRAFDNAQNHSSAATTVTLTTLSSSGDTIAPSAGTWDGSAADKPGIGDRVVRRTGWPRRSQSGFRR